MQHSAPMTAPTTKTRLSFLPDFPGRDRLYQPLNSEKGEIRVINILPSSERSEPISCSLETISITNGRGANYYHALSYYWGSTAEGDREDITVYTGSPENRHEDGFHVPVTKQLTGALRQFRSRMESMDHPLVLWTDAVCINQLDADERAYQVTIMRHVYASAISTWIWLGEDDPLAEQGLASIFGLSLLQLEENEAEVNEAEDNEQWVAAGAIFDNTDFDVSVDLSCLEEANDFIMRWRRHEHLDAIRELRKQGVSIEDIRNLPAPHIPDELIDLFHTLGAFCNVPYWSRGWVLQESCANEHVVLHCGQTRCRVIRWTELLELSEAKFQITDEPLFKLMYPSIPKLAVANSAIGYFVGWLTLVQRTLSKFRRSELFGSKLESILVDSSTPLWAQVAEDLSSLSNWGRWQTTDPRDTVYAMLGFMPGFMALRLKPNYHIDTERLFIRTTLDILQAVRAWSVPQFIYPSASPFLPSWTIDFTLRMADTQNRRFLTRNDAKLRFKTALGVWSKTEELTPGVLLSAGFACDEIVAVTPVYSPLDLLISPANTVRAVDRLDMERFGTRSMFWKWWNTLINEQNKQYISYPELELWELYCRTLFLGSKDFSSTDAASCRQWKLDSNPVEVELTLPPKLDYELDSNIFSSARLVITRKGRIGLAPLAVEPGDHIAVLAGGDVPFALRRGRHESTRLNAYRLLGGCYIDGPVPRPHLLHILLTCAGIMYGGAVFPRAFKKYKALDSGIGSLKRRRLVDEHAEVKLSVKLAFLDYLCLV